MDKNKLVGGLEDFFNQPIEFKKIEIGIELYSIKPTDPTEPPIHSLYAVDPLD